MTNSALYILTRLFVITTFFLVLLLLHGCYVISDPDLWPSDFVQKDTLPVLVGKSEAEVLEKLGPPQYVVRKKDSVSYLYEKLDSDTAIAVFIYIPFWFTRHETEVSCVLLNFDKNGVLQGYVIESGGAARGGGYEVVYNCTNLFDIKHWRIVDYATQTRLGWISPEEMRKLRSTLIFGTNEIELRKLAEEGDAEALLQLYWFDINDEEALKWLCRAADQGDSEAQYRLGLLYEYGSEGVPKDVVMSYVWYRLSYASGEYMRAGEQAKRILESLSAGQAMLAERLIRERQPDQCERDLVPLVTY